MVDDMPLIIWSAAFCNCPSFYKYLAAGIL